MFNFVIECISLSIISLIIISIGYYIYDYYISINQKTNEDNKSIEFKTEMDDINIDELENLITKDEKDVNKDDNNSNIKVDDTKNNEQNEDEETDIIEKNEKEDEDTIEKNGKKYKIKKNNSLSSMDELDTIKLSLNKMLNDLNTKK